MLGRRYWIEYTFYDDLERKGPYAEKEEAETEAWRMLRRRKDQNSVRVFSETTYRY
jgi:hypothetical protein